MKTTLIGMAFLGASLVVWGGSGCGKKEASCDAVFEHVQELAPKDLRDMIAAGKDAAIAKCEKDLSSEQRKCILDATDLTQVSACKKR
jgi:hypothetical protein